MGLLALAGGLEGAGSGVASVAHQTLEEQHKLDYAKVLNTLGQQREEAITRLQHKLGMQSKEYELRGQSAIAQFKTGQAHKEAELERRFQQGQQRERIASEERRTERSSEAREHVADVRADAVSRKGGGGKEWEIKSEKMPDTFDPVTHQPVGGATVQIQFNHRLGQGFVPVGPDKYMPYDATLAAKGKLPDPSTTRRVSAEATQDLINDPFGKTPSGNYKSDVFLARNGYLPTGYFASAHRYQEQQGGQTVSSRSSTMRPAGSTKIGGGTLGEQQTEGNDSELNAPEAPELPPLPGEDVQEGGGSPSPGGSGVYRSIAE